MQEPYDLLQSILKNIETDLKDTLTTETLAKRFALSDGHLRRMFRFTFKQSLGGYIRERKLSASINDLLTTDMTVLDVALEYGFEHESSYIRSFKHAFGITPGDLRKSGTHAKLRIVKVKPPLYLYDEHKMGGGLFIGPDFVMVPRFHVIGRCSRVPYDESLALAPRLAIEFWEQGMPQIKKILNPHVYYGITINQNNEKRESDYISSVRATDTKHIPAGFMGYTFNTALCARFRYIGRHHYYAINRDIARRMYEAIWNYAKNPEAKYALLSDKVYFERVDTRDYDGVYCQMEWLTPVAEKL